MNPREDDGNGGDAISSASSSSIEVIGEVVGENETPPPEYESDMEEEEDEDEDIEPEEDNSHAVFDKHNEWIFSCDITRDGNYALTGGKDDVAYLWRTNEPTRILATHQHDDSVNCVGFNEDNTRFATLDMSGRLYIKTLPQLSEIINLPISDDCHYMTWNPSDIYKLAVGTSSGITYIFNTRQPIQLHEDTFYTDFTSPNTAGAYSADGNGFVAGYTNGDIAWKVGSNIGRIQNLHEAEVTCLDINRNATISYSGSTDSTARIANLNNGSSLHTLQCGNNEPNSDSVEAIRLATHQPWLVTGTCRGHVQLWDVNTATERSKADQLDGITRIIWSKRDPNLIFVGCLRPKIVLIDVRNMAIVKTFLGHRNQILDIANDSTDNLLTASKDSTSRLFRNE